MIVPPMQPSVRFDVIVNGRTCAQLTALTGAGETAVIELPDGVDSRGTGCLAVRIDVHSTMRLSDHELSADTRSLGLGLVSLALVANHTAGATADDDTASDTP
jgi:hypothetical protein